MKRKLIEVALPLEAINRESAREKSPFTRGHPRAMHPWWARRPLVAARAVIFASLVDDPSSHPERFPTEEAQEAERQRLFRLIEELVKWENTTNERVLEAAREEIRRSTHGKPPPLLDPFAGGGSIPLEAQRLGLEAHASDLNPVAVLINKALIEIPPKFADQPPIHPDARAGMGGSGSWKGAAGLAEDIRRYGVWMRDEAERRIGNLYPKVKLPPLRGGGEATAVAWLWARTVKCPNPACGAEMPLVRSWALSTKRGAEAYLEPHVDHARRQVSFEIRRERVGEGDGTKAGRGASFACLVCGHVAPDSQVKSVAGASGFGTKLLAAVVDASGRRIYVRPESEDFPFVTPPASGPVGSLPDNPRWFSPPLFGLTEYRDLFTARQLAVLSGISDLIAEVRQAVESHGGSDDYGRAIATYLGLAVSRLTDFSNALTSWDSGNGNLRQLFSRQAIPMTWDFAETNVLDGVVSLGTVVEWVATTVERSLGPRAPGSAQQADAVNVPTPSVPVLVITDPPYYDNIGYAELSDFFYVWLRQALRSVWPDLFATLETPKSDELVASPGRFAGGAKEAAEFFEAGLTRTFTHLAAAATPEAPVGIFYAYKQAEVSEGGTASTGWETMLEALLGAGLSVVGTWPLRTEQQQRSVAIGTNALASSIVLVCRPRPEDAVITDRKAFLSELRSELPGALRLLQHGNIAPVDLAQASIGPGMAVFSRYTKVVEPSGEPLTVRTALGLINQVLGELLTEQEDDFDADTRWAITWFEEHRYGDGDSGRAILLSVARDTAINALEQAGIIESRFGKVRLLRSEELQPGWDPATDRRTPVWEITQRLIFALNQGGGVEAAADIVRRTGGRAEVAKELAYRLYVTCERKNWADEARDFNSLVVDWSEITKLASGIGPGQGDLGLGG